MNIDAKGLLEGALSPCPFCGSEPKFGFNPSAYVSCGQCGTEGPWFDGVSNRGSISDFEAQQLAIESWNNRPDLALNNIAKDKEIEALREALASADDALRNHACHGGPDAPCLRTSSQCHFDCGKQAGDALVTVLAALKREVPGV